MKLRRVVELGPKYYFWDLPRYFARRRALGLGLWDPAALTNPFREFYRRIDPHLPIPPRFDEALAALTRAGARVSMPPLRLRGLAAVWWSTREVVGDVIEFGAYRGATSLCLALLASLHGMERRSLVVDAFSGLPATGANDLGRTEGEFAAGADQPLVIQRQAETLGIADRIEVHAGLFADVIDRLRDRSLVFSLAHIDANLYQGTLEATRFALARAAPGGAIVFDDYAGVCDLGARLAIDQALRSTNLRPRPLAGPSAFIRVK